MGTAIDSNIAAMARNMRFLPGGMTSTNRKIDRDLVMVRAEGAEVVDADGRRFIDYNCGFGTTILGHCDPDVADAVAHAMRTLDLVGLSSSVPEGELAELLVSILPCAEQVVLVNTGSEATYHAIRLARAVTDRPKLVKFQGGYHGWHDYVAMNQTTPAEKIGKLDLMSAGVLPAAAENTLVARFNDLDHVEKLFRQNAGQIAAVIIEPIQHNIGCVAATQTFLEGLRTLTHEHSILLIFDEVVTGFRHGLGGYQEICGVTPDLVAVGKAMGNGVPIAAIGGSSALFRRFWPAPDGDVLLAGTYNGAPAMIAAALTTIRRLQAPDAYPRLYALGETMRRDVRAIFERAGFPAQVAGYGSVWLPYFFTGEFARYEDLLQNDTVLDQSFRRAMIDRGFLTTPVPMKRYNFNLAHTDEHVARTLQAVEDVVGMLSKGRAER